LSEALDVRGSVQRVGHLLVAVRGCIWMHLGVVERRVPILGEPISVIVRRGRINATSDDRAFVVRLLSQAPDEPINCWKPLAGVGDERRCLVMKGRLLPEEHEPPTGSVWLVIMESLHLRVRAQPVVAHHRQHRDEARDRVAGRERVPDPERDREHRPVIAFGSAAASASAPSVPVSARSASLGTMHARNGHDSNPIHTPIPFGCSRPRSRS
jgi:hypothetical protein